MLTAKFEFRAFDWFRFWKQSENEVDKQEIVLVTKYPYVKRLLLPHLWKLIDGMHSTSEVYYRVRAVFLVKFGKPAVVGNAHVKCIIFTSSYKDLPKLQS